MVSDKYIGANCHALIVSRTNKNLLHPNYLSEYMNSDQGKSRVSIIATGGAHPHLNTTDLREELIAVPPIEEQERIVKALESISEKAEQVFFRNEKLKALKKALMQDLLTGKVRVTPDSE